MNSLSFKAISFALIISVIGITSTFYLSKIVKKELIYQNSLKTENIAKQISIRLQDSIDISLNDLQGLQAFYSANQQEPDLDEFNKYMHVTSIDDNSDIQTFSWIPLITHNNREKYENKFKFQRPNFSITAVNRDGELIKSKQKDYYTPVTYIRPYEKFKGSHGFDVSSNKNRKKSLEYARDTGKITTTEKILLVPENSPGFLILAPVFKYNSDVTNIKNRRDALLGYVSGVFRISALMKNALEQATMEGFSLRLLDLDKENGGILYGEANELMGFDYQLTIPNRHWQLDVSLTNELQKNINSPTIANWILWGGVVISLLLAISIYFLKISVERSRKILVLGNELQVKNKELEGKVAERTESLAEKNNELILRIDELARSNKDLDDFAYVASHDLKAPLRGIMQLSSWIEEDIQDYASDETKGNLQLLIDRTSRLEKLLGDLLDYARIGRKEGDIQSINTKNLVLDIFDLQDNSENIILHCQETMPTIRASATPFETIIRNLIGNAIKHNHEKYGIITISAKEYPDYYEFSVKDNGPGIPEEYHVKIFELFRTLKPRDEVEGSGMGLSIIKKLLDYQKGSIVVKSDGEKGTCFTFTWPKLKED